MALILPCLPCILHCAVRERRRWRTREAIRLRITNQRCINAANAEAACLAAVRPAPEDVPLPEESEEGDGVGADNEALAPAIGNDSASEQRTPDIPPAGSAAELETVEAPTPAPGDKFVNTIAPPPPAHVIP